MQLIGDGTVFKHTAHCICANPMYVGIGRCAGIKN